MRSAAHPYTQGLLGATVHAGMRGQRLTTIPGSPPNLERLPPGCAFAPRCSLVASDCLAAVPALQRLEAGRSARCIRAQPLAA
ncbi:putative D,D-dipeptide transport ATP-binding protein DdpD [compost metagenome]